MISMDGRVVNSLWVKTASLNPIMVCPGSFLTSWLQRIEITRGMRKVSCVVCIFLCTEVLLSESNLRNGLVCQRCLTKRKN